MSAGPLKISAPNAVTPLTPIGTDDDAGAAGRLVGEPCDQTGDRQSPGHIVVDADHMGPKAGIDRFGAARDGSAVARLIVNIGHGK